LLLHGVRFAAPVVGWFTLPQVRSSDTGHGTALRAPEVQPMSRKPRKAVSKRTRFEVFKRDNFTCAYCGKKPPDVMLELDHLVPVSTGGSNVVSNLVTSCEACNRGKSDVSLEEKIPDAFTENELARCQELLERRAAMRKIDSIMTKVNHEENTDVDSCVEEWEAWKRSGSKEQVPLPTCARTSFRTFLRYLPVAGVKKCITIAMERSRLSDYAVWKYFCGVAWSQIRSNQKNEEGATHDTPR
jgi:hypothetical protein